MKRPSRLTLLLVATEATRTASEAPFVSHFRALVAEERI